jgi:hypothetical protein
MQDLARKARLDKRSPCALAPRYTNNTVSLMHVMLPFKAHQCT